MSSTGRFEKLEPEECWRLLEATTVGRLGFSTDDGIVVLPVNFIPFDSAVYVRTDPDTVIAKLAEGRDDVAFEVDHHDDLLQRGWNVLLRGSTSGADTDDAERALASTSRLGPWAPGERPLLIKLSPRRVDGRRVSHH